MSGSLDTVVRPWDAATGDELLESMQGHRGGVSSVAFSPDGTHIVSASWDKTVRVWDAIGHREVLEPLRHNKSVSSVAFTSDGLHIISRDRDEDHYLWDSSSGTLISHQVPAEIMPTSGEIFLNEESGWITDRVTGHYLSKIPSSIHFNKYASHGRTLVLVADSGILFCMYFQQTFLSLSLSIPNHNFAIFSPRCILVLSQRILLEIVEIDYNHRHNGTLLG